MKRNPTSAVLGASAASGVWSGLVLAAAMVASLDGGVTLAPMIFLIGTLYSAAICLIFTCTLGLAWHTIALARGWKSWKAYLLAGSLSGALSATGLAIVSQSDELSATWGFLVCWFASVGAVAAITAWLIRRPDCDERKSSSSPP